MCALCCPGGARFLNTEGMQQVFGCFQDFFYSPPRGSFLAVAPPTPPIGSPTPATSFSDSGEAPNATACARQLQKPTRPDHMSKKRAHWKSKILNLGVVDHFGRPPSKTRPKENGPPSPASFSLARAAFWPLAGGTSLFPAKREVKREVAKVWLAWPGNQTSSRSLVRSLVWPAGRGGGREAARGDLRPPSRPLWWHWGKQSSRRPLEKKRRPKTATFRKEETP